MKGSSMSTASFHEAMLNLHQRLGLDASKADEQQHDLYVINVGGLDIEMVGTQAGYINLMCFPGELPKLTVDSLSMLLAANRYQEENPAISISLLDDAPPSRVVLWSRIGLAAADPDRLGALFLRFVETAHATRTWLSAGAPGFENGKQ